MSLKEYETREALMSDLADVVAMELQDALNAKGVASLAVPGGTTPAPFLNALSKKDLAWERVSVMLGDERFVDENSARSNTRLLKENLFINHAERANFVSLLGAMESPESAVLGAIEAVNAVMPLDVLVVGMGEDMHTASLFPDSPDISSELSPEAPSLVVIHAENAGEPRISLSANALRAAHFKHVLITGEAKLQAYEQALKEVDAHKAPIRVVLINDRPATVHYAK